MCIVIVVNKILNITSIKAQALFAFEKQTSEERKRRRRLTQVDLTLDLRANCVSAIPLGSVVWSYLIIVWSSASVDGGPLLRRDGFTNTPWPGGQRK